MTVLCLMWRCEFSASCFGVLGSLWLLKSFLSLFSKIPGSWLMFGWGIFASISIISQNIIEHHCIDLTAFTCCASADFSASTWDPLLTQDVGPRWKQHFLWNILFTRNCEGASEASRSTARESSQVTRQDFR